MAYISAGARRSSRLRLLRVGWRSVLVRDWASLVEFVRLLSVAVETVYPKMKSTSPRKADYRRSGALLFCLTKVTVDGKHKEGLVHLLGPFYRRTYLGSCISQSHVDMETSAIRRDSIFCYPILGQELDFAKIRCNKDEIPATTTSFILHNQPVR